MLALLNASALSHLSKLFRIDSLLIIVVTVLVLSFEVKEMLRALF